MNYKYSPFSFLTFLSKNKGVNILFIAVYFVLVVAPHEWFGSLIVDLFANFSRTTYQIAMLIIAVIFILAYLIFLFGLLKRNLNFLSISTLIILLALTVLSYPILIIHYVEAIHFLQYAILGFLLFPLFRNYYKVLFWGLVLSFIDEGYQYFILDPEATQHFDFNDVLLNQLGIVYGVFPVALKGNMPMFNKRLNINSIVPEIIMTGVITTVVILLCNYDVLSIYPDKEIPFNIVKRLPQSFWTHIKHLDINYHIVMPFEGLVLVLVFYIYFSLSLSRIHHKPSNISD